MSLLDKLINAYKGKGANRTSSNNKSKGSSSTAKTKPVKKKPSGGGKTSTPSQSSPKQENRGYKGASRTTSGAKTKSTSTPSEKKNTPSNTGWSAYVKNTLASRDAYRSKVEEQAKKHTSSNKPTYTSRAQQYGATERDVYNADSINKRARDKRTAYQYRVQAEQKKAREERAKNNPYTDTDKRVSQRITTARALGATGEDVVNATRQSAIANTKYHQNHQFLAGITDYATPSYWKTYEGGDSEYYSDAMKRQIEESQQGLAYGAGALAGNAVQFMLPSSMAMKVGSKAIKGGSALSRGAKMVGLDTAFSSPLDLMQSYRDAKDINGNVDAKQFAINMGANVGLNALMGGAGEVGGAVLSKLQLNKLINLQTKANNGEALTPKETQDLISLYEKATSKASEGNASSAIAEGGIKKFNEKEGMSAEDTSELIDLKGKVNAGKGTEDDKIRLGQLEDKAQTVVKQKNIVKTAKRVDSLNKLTNDTGVNYKMVSEEEMHAKAKELDADYDPNNEYNGVKFTDENGKDTVYINQDSEKSFYVTVGHETLHAIKGADEQEYNNLSKLIADYAKANDEEGYNELVSAMKRDYTEGEVDEEMTAELVGKYLFGEDGEKFINDIATKEPNIFKRLYDYIMKAFDKNDPQLKQVRDSFEKIYKQMGGESKTNGKAEFSATKKNEGYHAGDLGKSESLAQQSGGRGTGHFGTGTYFVGDKARIEGYNTRDGKPAPVETVDFTDYNLYKPKDYEQGYQLHSFLKGINEYYDTPDNLKTGKGIDDVVEQADDIDRRLFEASGEHEEMYWDDDLNDWFFVPAPRNEMAIELAKKDLYELAEKNLGKYRIDDIAKVDPDADADDFLRENGWVTSPEKMSDETTQKLLRKLSDDSWHSWQDMARDRAEFFEDMERMIKESGLEGREKEISDALSEIREELQDVRYPQSATHDSASTMLMKKLGYEGIDVRGIDQLDNTKYGSVIYDLKGDALKRKQEIGTAKFSKAPRRTRRPAMPVVPRRPKGYGSGNTYMYKGKQYRKMTVVDYNRTEYNHHGWAFVNNLITRSEQESLQQAISDMKLFKKRKRGEIYGIPVRDGEVFTKIIGTDAKHGDYSVEWVLEFNASNDVEDLIILKGALSRDGDEGFDFFGDDEILDILSENENKIYKRHSAKDYSYDEKLGEYREEQESSRISKSNGELQDRAGDIGEAGDIKFSKKKKNKPKSEEKPTEEVGSFNGKKPSEVNFVKETPNDGVKPNDDGIEITSLKDTPEYKKFQEKKQYHSENLDIKVELAERHGVDVRERLGEFNDLGDEIAANRAKRKNSKDEVHKEEYLAKIDELETRQTEIARSIYQDVSDARLKEMRENPSSIDKDILEGKSEWNEKDLDDITAEDVRTSIEDAGGFTTLVDDINKAINSGDFGELKGSLKGEADKKAKAEVDADIDDAIKKFLASDFIDDAQLQASRYDAIASKLAQELKNSPNDKKLLEKLLNVTDHLADKAVLDGKVLSTVLDVSKSTPKGRVAVAQRTIDRINARVSQRIGKTFELTDEEKIALATTPKGKEFDELYNKIAYRVYDDIPATAVEKVNELRHLFMLGNARTHFRNITGNGVFKGVRGISDYVEAGLQHMFQGSIEKRGGSITKSHVTHDEMSKNNDFLKSEFEETYRASGGSNRFNETMRPDGVTANKGILGWLVNKNYRALEAEDMWFFEPAFKKGYMKFVKSKGWDIDKLSKRQISEAREFALREAEYATFRDSCAFSSWLTGKKEFLAQAKGRSALGTTGYRVANMALDSVIPFVKTPVNVFRRSIDFSPLSLGRGLIEMGSKNPDTFMEGIKHISTGLTGTGIFGLGYFLSNSEMISLNVGNGQHSGDEYYDRELGYQDYSLVINVGGVHKSMTIDWMSPIQTSLFMGAVAHQTWDNMMENAKEGSPLAELGDDAIAGLYAMTTPALDASFMSSTKDLIDKFSRKVEQNSGEDGKSVPMALAEVMLADMPKNYVSSLVPQFVSQLSQVADPTQRSTKSTKAGLGGALESGALQIINKTPLRTMLPPKLDRMGKDVVNEDNIGMRMFNALVNPSNVKNITENEYDRQLIAIRNSIEDKTSTEYKYFFANFTGNPNFDLGEDGRMTRQQAYEYAKASRSSQWDMVTEMIDSDRYKKYMTDGMKVKEVSKAYWNSQIAGDRTISDNYALKKIFKDNSTPEGESPEQEAFRQLKLKKGAGAETTKLFLDFYEAENKLYAQGHASGSSDSYYRKALVAYSMNSPELIEAYGIYDDKTEAMETYWKAMKKEYGKNAKDEAFKEVTNFTCGITASLEKAGFYKKGSKVAQCIGAGMMFMNDDKQPERVYRAHGYNWNEAQGGAGLCKYNTDGRYDYDNLEAMKSEVEKASKKAGHKSITKAEAVNYVQGKLDSGEITQDEARCLYVAIYSQGSGYANPFGDVDDHLEWNKDSDEMSGGSGKGYGGRRRGGRRGHGGGGHGGSKKSGSGAETDWYKFVGDMTTASQGKASSNVHDFTSKSKLDDAYRRRVRKLKMQ